MPGRSQEARVGQRIEHAGQAHEVALAGDALHLEQTGHASDADAEREEGEVVALITHAMASLAGALGMTLTAVASG
jgi:hypothetical protein